MTKLNKNKREKIVYITIFLWMYFLGIGIYFDASLMEMSSFFLSLTGFVGSYIWGESVRKSDNMNPHFFAARSKREKVLYLTILIWTLIGSYSIYGDVSLTEIATYFGSLTPFVGAFILGETYKKDK